MRDYLISIAIGFLLGGLVLVPLCLQRKSLTNAGAPGGNGQSDLPIPPASQHPNNLSSTGHVHADPQGKRAQREAPTDKRQIAIEQTVQLPKRIPVDMQTIMKQSAWRGEYELRSLGGSVDALVWTGSQAASRAGGFINSGRRNSRPVHFPVLPLDFKSRDDSRVQHGLVASTLLAVLPRNNDTDLEDFTVFTRLDDEPAVTLPESIVPSSVRQIIELDIEQEASNAATLNPVPLTSRRPFATQATGSASPIIDTTANNDPVIAYGPTIPYGPQSPTTTTSGSQSGTGTTAAPSSDGASTPVIPTSSSLPGSTPTQPAPTQPESTSPAPLPVIPEAAPTIPQPSAPTPNAPVAPSPSAPTSPSVPQAPAPVPAIPTGFPPAQPQLPGDHAIDQQVQPIPDGVELVFGGTFYGGGAGIDVPVNDEPIAGSASDWEDIVGELNPVGNGGTVLNVSTSVSAVPEPMSGVLLAAGVALLGRRRVFCSNIPH